MIRQHSFVSIATSSRAIFSEVLAVAVFATSTVAGVGTVWSAVVGSTVGAASLVPVRGRSMAWWTVVAVRRRADRFRTTVDNSRVTSLPFEHGRNIGVRWDGRRLSGTIEISPAFSGTSVIELGASRPDVRLPLNVLESVLARHDLRPVSIDVSSHGRRVGSDTNAADVYRRLIGPLPAVATRSVFVTVTLDTSLSADAVARRGDGFAGATRTFAVALGRVERALSGAGVRPRILTASEFPAVAKYFAAGVRPGGPRWVTGWALRPRDINSAVLERLWATPSIATTITLKLRHSDQPGRVMAAAAYTITDSAVLDRAPVRASIPLRGSYLDVLRFQEPTRTGSDDAAIPLGHLPSESLSELVVPVSGCGQLIGSDTSGRAVAARLWGPGTGTVHVRGELFLARQLVFRAIAVGAGVLVSSERPIEWLALARSLADARSLTVMDPSARLPASATGGYDLVVVDGHSSRPPTPSSTTMYLRDGVDGVMPDQPDISIVQPGCAGEDVVLISATGTDFLTLVTVGQETAFIGRPRLTADAQLG